MTPEDLELHRNKRKRHLMGYMKFIGELWLVDVMKPRVVGTCIVKLLELCEVRSIKLAFVLWWVGVGSSWSGCRLECGGVGWGWGLGQSWVPCCAVMSARSEEGNKKEVFLYFFWGQTLAHSNRTAGTQSPVPGWLLH